jgi:hypothetical protein
VISFGTDRPSYFNHEALAMYNGAEKTSYLVTRRGVVSGGAAMITAGAALSHETTVHAAAPIAAKQAPGCYRYKVGEFEVTVITEGALAFPVENFVSNATTEQVRRRLRQPIARPMPCPFHSRQSS